MKFDNSTRLTLTMKFNLRIMFLNISSSFGGIWDVNRRICPVLGSGTLKVSERFASSSTIPDHGKRWRILKSREILTICR